MKTELVYKEESYHIIGSCMEVHKELGPGFLEPVYQEAVAIQFRNDSIPFEKEKELVISYKEIELRKRYIADFVCFERIIVELKALNCITTDHEAQVLNYLKATGCKLGLLVNFGESKLTYKRLVY